ncbi:MAG: LAGLIDADG family homing endonuclease, partial [Candidatus Thorarchaeota archaeon]
MWNAFIKDEFKDDPKVKKAFENAWLGLHGIDEKKIFNPLEDIPTQFEGDIPTYITYLLSLPEYFPFFAEEFLNIKLAPFQCVILDELWKRKFPMLIASRGGSKTFSMAVHCLRRLIFLPERKIVIAGAGFRQSKLVFEYMEKIWDNAPLLRDIASAKGGRVGYTHEPDRHTFRLNGGTCLAIPIGNFGEKIRGLRAHDLICVTKDTLVQTDKGLIYIKDYLDGTNKNVMNIDKEFEKPSHIIITEPANVYKITTRNGFEIKCSDSHRIMTSNGWKMASELTINDYIEIDSNDYFPSDYVKHEDLIVDEEIGWLLGLLISEGSVESRHHIGITNTDYDLITRIKNRLNWDWKEYHRNEYVDKRGFDCKESWRIQFNCTGFREKLYKLGLDYSVHKDKTIPWCILQSPKSVVVEFLKGLFEGDGSLFSYSPTANTNKTMIGAAYYSRSRELCRTLQILLLKFGIYGAFTDKKYSNWSEYKQSVVQFRGEPAVLLYDLLKLKKCGLLEHEFSFKKPVPSIIRKKIKTDRFILSTWKGNKNTYIGSYDSEEECYKAFDEYWVNTRKCFKIKSIKKLAKKEVLYDFHLPKKHSFIGNGIVNHNCDEFSAIPRNIFETVLAGFTVVSSDPVSGMMQSRFEEIAREEGWWDDEQVSDTGEKISNSLVISGTPGFSFQHFCAY